jgi:hypothetical protein
VAVRTALQEEADEEWMAMMMSLYEALFQSVPGAGMLIGGGITAAGSPRTALAVAGAGSLAVTAAAWLFLTGLGSRTEPRRESPTDPAGPGPRQEPPLDPARAGPRRDPARTPAVRHQ